MRHLLYGASIMALTASPALAQSAYEDPGNLNTITLEQAQQAAADGAREIMFTVYFEFDESELLPEARETIREAAAFHREGGGASIAIRGYTDTAGPADYNRQLSERRAQAVRQALMGTGIPADEIEEMIAEGETDLAVETPDGEPEPLNRRVDIELPAPPPPAPAVVEAEPEPEPEPAPIEPAAGPVEPETGGPRFTMTLGGLYGFDIDDGHDQHDNQFAGAEISIGTRLIENVSLSLDQGGFYAFDADDEGFGGRSVAGIDLQTSWFFKPYIGANVGYQYGAGVEDGLIYGPELGFKIDQGEHAFYYLKAAYDFHVDADWDEGAAIGGIGFGWRY